MVDYYVTCNNENFEISNCAVTIVIMDRRKIFGIKFALDEAKSRKQTSLYIYIKMSLVSIIYLHVK